MHKHSLHKPADAFTTPRFQNATVVKPRLVSAPRWHRMLLGVAAGSLLLLSPLAVLAQGSEGTILGVVKDSTGANIPNVSVTIRNTDTNVTRNLTSEKDGAFRAPALPVGNYEITASHDGFRSVVQQGIILTVSAEQSVNFTLPVGTAEQSVQVQTGQALVNTTDSQIGDYVGEHAVQDLPLNGRNYVDLALMQPGTNQDYGIGGNGAAGGTAFSNHGSTPWSNLFTLDGAILNNALAINSASQTGTTLGLDGIREFKIVGIPDASYGLVMGGQVLLASKSGTNQFHGTIFDYLRNSIFDARNYFDYGYRAVNGPRIPHFSRNQFGASVGGPVRKDKTFFYLTFEGLRSSQGASVIDTVPAATCFGTAGTVVWNGQGAQPAGSVGPCTQLGANPAGTGTNSVRITPTMAPLLALYPTANLPNNQYTFPTNTLANESYGQVRIDHTISDRDSLFGRYTADDASINVYGAFPQYRQIIPGLNQFLTIGETHILSPNLLNGLSVSVSRTTQTVSNLYTTSEYNDAQHSFVTGLPMGSFTIAGLTGFGAQTTKPSVDNQTLYTLADDVSYTRGRHSMKFGTLLNLYRQAAGTNGNANGSLTFANLAAFLQGNITTAQTLSLPAGTKPIADYPNVNRYFGYSVYGFYAQDSWRVVPRLTFNYGVRYEPMDTVNELNGNGYALRNLATDTASTPGPLMKNPTLKNFSPRAGFAYDVFGDGKMSIRGGFGLYRDIGNLGSELREYLQGTPPYGITSLGAQTNITLPLSFAGGLVGRTAQTVNYNARAPYSEEFNLTVERQIFGLGVSATYVGTHGIHIWSRGEGNPVIPAGYEKNGNPYYSSATSQPACVLNVAPFCRVNPYFSVITLNANTGSSTYNSLELNIVKQLSRGVEFQTSYTRSQTIDDTANMGGFENGIAGCAVNSNPLNRRNDRGPACFDTPNKFNVNMIYHTPKFETNGFVSTFLNGWYVSNIVTIQSGVPFTPIFQQNRTNSGVFIQQGYVDHVQLNTAASIAATFPSTCTSMPGQPAAGSNPCLYTPIPFDNKKVATGNPNQWINPAMFSLSSVGHYGTASRDMLRSPYILVWNASAVKETPIHLLGDKGALQFRAELFNPMNKANFGVPSGVMFTGSQADTGPYSEAPLATAGQITSTLTTARQVQLALKLLF